MMRGGCPEMPPTPSLHPSPPASSLPFFSRPCPNALFQKLPQHSYSFCPQRPQLALVWHTFGAPRWLSP